MEVFGTDYPTPDGTCIRDYIHVSDLARAHVAALALSARRRRSPTSSIAATRSGFSVLEVIDAVKRVSGVDFDVRMSPRRAGRSRGHRRRPRPRSARGSAGGPSTTISTPIVAQALAWERRVDELRLRPDGSRRPVRSSLPT